MNFTATSCDHRQDLNSQINKKKETNREKQKQERQISTESGAPKMAVDMCLRRDFDSKMEGKTRRDQYKETEHCQ